MLKLKIRFKIILLACLSSFLLASSAEVLAQALTPDEEQPVHISANSLDAQEKKGVSIYKGNVIVTQGSLTLTGDEIIVKHPDNQLQTVKSTGQPSSFKRFSQAEQSWLKGKANMIEYDALNKTVLLVGSAQVEQPGQHLIKGPRLFYDMVNQTLKAQGTEQEKGRISVTFNPVTKTKSNPVLENKPTPVPPEQ